MIEQRPGLLVFQVTGAAAAATFANEAGGHKFQRVPKNEKRDRVHSSTITVAVLPEPTADFVIRESDIEWMAVKGTGPGGQHKNTTESAILVRHKPTKIEARCQSERSQHKNKASALAVLRARVWEWHQQQAHAQHNAQRKQQVGLGMRGDKRRTVRMQDGQVTDHLTGQKWSLQKYLNGEW